MTTHEWLNRARVLDDELFKLQSQFIDVKIQLVDTITKLEDRSEQIVLLNYYCNGRTWNEIADSMDISYNTVNRIRKAALQHMEGVLNKENIITGKAGNCDL